MIDNSELGYTPNNLRALREKYGLTQTDVAKATNTKHQQTVAKWEAALDAPMHADMPHTKWAMLIEFMKKAGF